MVKQTAKWIDVLDLIELLRGVNVDFVLISAKPSTHTHTHTNANANTKKNNKSGLYLFVRYTQILRSLNKS